MPKQAPPTHLQLQVLARLAEGWQIVGHFVVDPATDRPLETRKGVPRIVIKSLAEKGYITRIVGAFAPSYEISDAGRAILLAYEGDE